VIPAGFAGGLHLTVPLTTLLDLADRPGEIPGLGAVDPALARDLAGAAAQNLKTTWCVTVTDEQGHAIGHGCAGPEPKGRAHPTRRDKPGPPGEHDPPGGLASARGPGFTFTAAADQAGPGRPAGTVPGGYLPVSPGSGTCWSCSTRLPPRPATTGMRLRVMTRASSCGIYPRSGTPRVPGRAAVVPRPRPTSSTTFPTKPVAERVCVMADLSAGTTIGSSSTPAGASSRSPRPRKPSVEVAYYFKASPQVSNLIS
jgi:hypothetical protein